VRLFREPFFESQSFLVLCPFGGVLFEIVNMERETQAAFGCELILDISTSLAFTLIYLGVDVGKVTDCFDVSFYL
jgi:hypothetical protein